MDLWLIFITGLTVGGLTCMAVQGGLLASVLAAHLKEEHEMRRNFIHNSLPTIAFLATKFIAYSLLGLLLGLLGQTISLSDSTRIILQLIAGLLFCYPFP